MSNYNFTYPKEAFALMQYWCSSCGKSEFLWNSRDGVTPFMINCCCCGKTMNHVNWSNDLFAPNHIPAIGDRVFYSCKNIHEIIQAIMDQELPDDFINKYGWAKYGITSIEQWMEKQIEIVLENPHRFEEPWIATITEDNRHRFIEESQKVMALSYVVIMEEQQKAIKALLSQNFDIQENKQ